jgi:hypothetical protein
MRSYSFHKKVFFIALLNPSLQNKFIDVLGDRSALGPIEPNRIGMRGIQHSHLHQLLDRAQT